MCPRRVSQSYARGHYKISAYVRNTHTHTNHGFKSPDGNQLIVSVGVCNRGNLFPATLHDKRVRKPQHVIEHAILHNATRRDPLCGSSNQRLAHRLPYTERSRTTIVMVDRGLFDHFECTFSREEFQNAIIFKYFKYSQIFLYIYFKEFLVNQDIKIDIKI